MCNMCSVRWVISFYLCQSGEQLPLSPRHEIPKNARNRTINFISSTAYNWSKISATSDVPRDVD